MIGKMDTTKSLAGNMSNISEICHDEEIVFSHVAATAAGVCGVLCSLFGAFLNLSTIIALLNYSK